VYNNIFMLLSISEEGERWVGGSGQASKQNIMCMLLSIFRQGEGGRGGGEQASQLHSWRFRGPQPQPLA